MIVDFHTHLGKCKPGFHSKLQTTIKDLVRMKKGTAVDKCVVFPFPQEPFPEKYKQANLKVASVKDPFIPFYWVNPYYFKMKEVKKIVKKYGVKGFKLHPIFDGYYPTVEFLKDIMRTAIELNIPTLFHSLWGDLGAVSWIEKVAEEFQKAKIVISHLSNEGIDAAKRQGNIYLDTSYAPHPRRIEFAVKTVGAEKLLFGSDFPYADPVISLKIVQRAKISERDVKLILGENAVKLLRIP